MKIGLLISHMFVAHSTLILFLILNNFDRYFLKIGTTIILLVSIFKFFIVVNFNLGRVCNLVLVILEV